MKRGKISLGTYQAESSTMGPTSSPKGTKVGFELPLESFGEADIWNESSSESQE